MTELFLEFLNISIVGSIMIGVIMLFRHLFSKTPKALICILWLIVFVRLIIPFRFEVSWNPRPVTDVFSVSSSGAVQQNPVFEDIETDQSIQFSENEAPVNPVDYVQIASVIWSVGSVGMLLYTFVSYWNLKRRVRDAILMERGVYTCSRLTSPFLLGYFVPKIYLPSGMESGVAESVIAHEKAHSKRLDNWLKLFAFLAMSLHWFNPLVWVAYIVLCRDVEEACDDAVIKNFDIQKRKTYSEALLSCGREKRRFAVCPVAFGEISIHQRIKNVLHYKKPTVWISGFAVLIILLTAVFFMTDPIDKHPPYYKELADLLGEPVEVVAMELGIEEESLVDITGNKDILRAPISVEYQGILFDIQLHFSRGTNLLSSFDYIAEYDGDYNQIVKPLATLTNHLLKAYGKVYQWDQVDREKRELVTTEEGIRSLFVVQPARIFGDSWDLTKIASKSAKTYLDQIEHSSLWQELYAEKAKKYDISPHFYLSYSAYYLENEGKSYILLRYATGWQPGSYASVMVTSDLDPSVPWWKRLLNSLK